MAHLEHESLVHVQVAALEFVFGVGSKFGNNGLVVQERLNPAHLAVAQIAILGAIALSADIIRIEAKLLFKEENHAGVISLKSDISAGRRIICEPGRSQRAGSCSKARREHCSTKFLSTTTKITCDRRTS